MALFAVAAGNAAMFYLTVVVTRRDSFPVRTMKLSE
jgi:hypothetical protein